MENDPLYQYWANQLSSGVSGSPSDMPLGFLNWQALPDYESFYRFATGNGDNYQEPTIDPVKWAMYADQNGITVQDTPTASGGSRVAVGRDGQPIEGTRVNYTNDSLGDVFKDVAKLAAIMGTAYLGGTALAGMGGGTAAGTAAGTAGTSGSTLGSLGTVTQLGTPMAEAAAMGSSIPVANLTAGLPTLAAPSLLAPQAAAFSPSMNYGPGMTGAQTSVYDSVIGATGSPTAANVASEALGPLSQAADWMKANPTAGRLLMSGATSLLSASDGGSSGGGYKDSGYRPTITRGGWSPNVQARQMPTQSVGLLNRPTTGQPMSGLWRYGLLG
jgi:hypothetical protein